MLIFRYLAKEVLITLASLTTILLLIFMSNQFVRYLNRAAAGQIPAMIIMKLMMLELPNLMGLLLPLGLFVSFLAAYGRLYTDSELPVLQACGYSTTQLLKHSLWIASIVALFVAIVMLWLSPLIATERTRLLRTTGVQTLIKTILPGRFQAVSGGQQVFYIETMNPEHTEANQIFLARQMKKNSHIQWDILLASHASTATDPQNFEDYIILKNGSQYQGIPGQANYQIAQFEKLKVRLPHPTLSIHDDMRTIKTNQLLPYFNQDLKKAAELQWRLSIPVMVIILAIAAVPLSRVNPRHNKYANLLPGIILFFIYANFLFIAKDWVASGKIPVLIGIWWLHAIMLSIGIFLNWRNRMIH